MTHDPLCPLTPPTADYEPYLAEAVRAIQQETPCQCDLIAKVRADERERLLEDWAAGKVQGDTSSDWILNAVRQKNYQQGVRDMLAKCVAVLDDHHPRCTDPCELCAEWDWMRLELESLKEQP